MTIPQRSEVRKWLLVPLSLLLTVLCLLETGCGPQWKRKFIRKGKVVSAPQPILELQSDVQATYPPAVRYQAHFAYWKSWHSELLSSLGQSRKRDLRYLSGVIGELRAQVELLTGPPAERLQGILSELTQFEREWQEAPADIPASTRTRLEQLQRQIDREFHYAEVKQWIPSGMSSSNSS